MALFRKKKKYDVNSEDENGFLDDEPGIQRRIAGNTALKEEDEITEEITEEQQDKQKITPVYKAVVIAISVLIVLSAGVFIYFYRLSATGNTLLKKSVPIQLPKYVTNNANYIYPSVSFMAGGEAFLIQKMLIDQSATVIYLNKKLNTAETHLLLRDDSGKTYEPEYLWLSESTNTLRFQPFTSSCKYFVLEISDAAVSFSITGRFDLSPAVFLTSIEAVNGSSFFKLDNIILSSAGTSIFYMYKNGKDGGAFLDTEGAKKPVLMEGFRKLQATEQTEYTFDDGTTIGRFEFAPVERMENQLELSVQGLYDRIDLGIELDAANLRQAGQETLTSFNAGPYEVTLERFGRQRNLYILVLHGVVSDNAQKRVETRLEAQLVFTSDTGDEMSIDGVCYSGINGCDIIFDAEKLADVPALTNLRQTLKIDSALFRIENATAKLNLEKSESELPDEYSYAFATALKEYENGQIVAYAMDASRMYICIMQGTDGAAAVHKLILERSGNSWTIINRQRVMY